MIDLKERLKSTWAHSHGKLINPDGPEAVERIEELEEALREIVNFDFHVGYSNAYKITTIARTVLGDNDGTKN